MKSNDIDSPFPISYSVSESETVSPGSDIWRKPLPLHRSGREDGASITTGDYFHAVRRFLTNDQASILCAVLTRHLERPIRIEQIDSLSLNLVKHGEFYHPAKINVSVEGAPSSLVADVAVSRTGKAAIQGEYRCLGRLNREFPFRHLPRVYESGVGMTEAGMEIPMFIGEWLEGYHEFHLTRLESDTFPVITVWCEDENNETLPRDREFILYRKAAGILTDYYNLETFERVYPWHHGAGDFVTENPKSGKDVKLITVRNYDSPVACSDPDPGMIFQGLFMFFIHLTLGMRIDRLDGVGEVLMASESVLDGVLNGFFESLSHKPPLSDFPVPLAEFFFDYLSQKDQSSYFDAAHDIMDAYHPEAPEIPVIQSRLSGHMEYLFERF